MHSVAPDWEEIISACSFSSMHNQVPETGRRRRKRSWLGCPIMNWFQTQKTCTYCMISLVAEVFCCRAFSISHCMMTTAYRERSSSGHIEWVSTPTMCSQRAKLFEYGLPHPLPGSKQQQVQQGSSCKTSVVALESRPRIEGSHSSSQVVDSANSLVNPLIQFVHHQVTSWFFLENQLCFQEGWAPKMPSGLTDEFHHRCSNNTPRRKF